MKKKKETCNHETIFAMLKALEVNTKRILPEEYIKIHPVNMIQICEGYRDLHNKLNRATDRNKVLVYKVKDAIEQLEDIK